MCCFFVVVVVQVRKKNVLKDFVTAAGPLGVTHFLVFTKTENCVNLVRSSTDLQEDAIIISVVNIIHLFP